MKYVRNIANKKIVWIKRKKEIPLCFQESQWRAILCLVSTEKANYERGNCSSLDNARENPTTEEQETLTAVCVWLNSVKGAKFLVLNKILYHLVERCYEASAQKITVKSRNFIWIQRRYKTSTTQHIQVFPHKSNFLMCP